MAAYTFKYVRDALPPYRTTDVEGYEGDPGYNGDQWEATARYIEDLEQELAKQCAITGVFHNLELFTWLMSRPAGHYLEAPAIQRVGPISLKSDPSEGLE